MHHDGEEASAAAILILSLRILIAAGAVGGGPDSSQDIHAAGMVAPPVGRGAVLRVKEGGLSRPHSLTGLTT